MDSWIRGFVGGCSVVVVHIEISYWMTGSLDEWITGTGTRIESRNSKGPASFNRSRFVICPLLAGPLATGQAPAQSHADAATVPVATADKTMRS